MDLHQSNEKIYGLAQGIAYGQHSRVDEINNRYTDRQFADKPLKPQFDIRAVPTKYSVFPLIDRRTPATVPYKQYLDHSPESNFCPNISYGPIDGYLKNIETESTLRNQYFALHRGADQAVFVPSSNSDLFKTAPAVGRQEEQPHRTIASQFNFEQKQYSNFAEQKIGQDRFNNNTRTQLRNTIGQ
jgi:hypothetical protein